MNKWLSFSNDGKWIYTRYDNQADALPIKFKKHTENGNGTYNGDCYTMQGIWNEEDQDFISFTTDGQWLNMSYNEQDAMRVVLVEQGAEQEAEQKVQEQAQEE
jgi:hypothetical protein